MSEGPQMEPRRLRRSRAVAIALAAIAAGTATGLWVLWHEPAPARVREELQQAVAAGRWEQVASLARRLTELDPQDGNAWMARARAADALGDPAGSARLLAQMPGENQEKSRVLQRLTEMQLGRLNTPLAAEQTLREMLEREPRSEFAHQRLIFYYALTLQRQKLAGQARQALELQCEPIDAYVYLFFLDSLHFSNGPAMNQRWLSGDPKSELFRVATAIQVATSLEGGPLRDDLAEVQKFRQMAEKRERVLAELFEQYPQNLELLAWQIDHSIQRGDIDRVIDLLGKLPPEADGDNRCLRFAGWAEARLGRDQEALTYYNQALAAHPLDWKTRHLIAELRRRQLKFDEVDRMEKLAQSADQLRRELEVAADASSAPPELLTKLADYAEQCGDELYVKSLRRRLASGIVLERASSSEVGHE